MWLEVPGRLKILAGLQLQVPSTTIIWLGVMARGLREIESFGRAVAPGPPNNNNFALDVARGPGVLPSSMA